MSRVDPREQHDIEFCDCLDCENRRRAEATHDHEGETYQPTVQEEPMLTENTGKTSAKTSTANSNGMGADEPSVMDTEAIARGIRATEIGIVALERAFRRDMERISEQLHELRRSIERGEPTRFVRRFGLAQQISNFGPDDATELADDVRFGYYYMSALEVRLWPLLNIANSFVDDNEFELKSHIREWCHGGAIDLDEETERQMFEAAGLRYTPSRVVRCFPDVTEEGDDDESRLAG